MSGSGTPALASARRAGSRGIRLKHLTRSSVTPCHCVAPYIGDGHLTGDIGNPYGDIPLPLG